MADVVADLAVLADPRRSTGLVVAAHPDDETIGAAGLVMRLGRCHVFHVTDGAPADAHFWTAPARSRAEYARIRRRELDRALRVAGVEPCATSDMGVVDQEAALSLCAIIRRVAGVALAVEPAFIVTHAYEGGHPDHDAVSFAVSAAVCLLARRGAAPPPVFEMALYHGGPGRLAVGGFLDPASDQVELPLTAPELSRKRSMLDCFESQAGTLAPFRALAAERFRPAPVHDFTRPPHAGPLLYERRGFAMTGEQWREHAARMLRALDLHGWLGGRGRHAGDRAGAGPRAA